MIEPGNVPVLSIRFPFGRYHATAAGTAPNEAAVEWPPSPWRLSRALIAVYHQRFAQLDREIVVSVLTKLFAHTPHFNLPTRVAPGQTRHYLPGVEIDSKQKKLKTFLTIDAFLSIAPSDPVLVAFPGALLDESEHVVLTQLVEGIAYLGRAESLCEVELTSISADELSNFNTQPISPAEADSADIERLVRVLVPDAPFDYDAATVNLELMRANSKTRQVQPPSTRWQSYVRPQTEVRTMSPAPSLTRTESVTAIRFGVTPIDVGRGAAQIPLSELIWYSSRLRSAAQSQYRKVHPESPSPTLSGRSGDDILDGHNHAHYLVLPDRFGADARNIDHFVVWAPRGFTPDEISALSNVRVLNALPFISGMRDVGVRMIGLGSTDIVVPELTAMSTRFSTITPCFPGRHHRGQHSWARQIELELQTACDERALPSRVIEVGAPVENRWISKRPQRKTGAPHPAPHPVTITFDSPVSGPICLGAQSHFGFGLFAPT